MTFLEEESDFWDGLTAEEQGVWLEIAELSLADWVLSDRQQAAEDLSGQAFELLYGGAAGGGKSDWLLWHVYHLALKFPGHHSLVLRNKYQDLEKTLILRSLGQFDRSLCRYNASNHTWFFGNGSVVNFGYLDAPKDRYNYISAEYQCIAWDELTTFLEEDYRFLFSRCRQNARLAGLGCVPHIVAATNPGGPGGVWVKKRFVDPAPPGEVFEAALDEEDPEVDRVRRVFVPAFARDNPHLDQRTYRRSLSGMSAPLRAALRDGRWDVVEGQFFDEWDPDLHVYDPQTTFPDDGGQPPRSWVRIRAVDFGYAAPYACVWVAFDPDGGAWLYREDYRRHQTPAQQGNRMVEFSKYPDGTAERIDYTVADPSCWHKTGVGDPIQQQWYMAGLRGLRPGMNARVDGWARVREFLRPDENNHVRLHVSSRCRFFIETFPQLVYDLDKVEDLDTDGEDHLADALRYGLMSRARKVRAGKAEPGSDLEAARRALIAALARSKRGRVFHPELGWVS